jgi:hypothetical protein
MTSRHSSWTQHRPPGDYEELLPGAQSEPDRSVEDLGILQQFDPGHARLSGECDDLGHAGAERDGLRITFARHRDVDVSELGVSDQEVPELWR